MPSLGQGNLNATDLTIDRDYIDGGIAALEDMLAQHAASQVEVLA